MNIKAKDLKTFLQKLGYTWDGSAISNLDKTWGLMKDYHIIRLNSENYPSLTICLNDGDSQVHQSLDISIDSFKFIEKDFGCFFGDIDPITDFRESKDFSQQWRKFLYSIYGEQYKRCLKECLKNKKSSIIKNLIAELKMSYRQFRSSTKAQISSARNASDMHKKIRRDYLNDLDNK